MASRSTSAPPRGRRQSLRLARGLSLPLSTVTETFAILARKGAGKTYAAMKLTEQLARAGQPVVALDPTGVWWGLRSSADGEGPGLPVVILGGEHADVPLEHADVPLEPAAGRLVADLVVDHPGSYVLDLSDFDSNAEQDTFAREFAERLYRRKARERSPLHLVVDEADAFAPQSPMPDQRRLLGAFQTLMRRGRSRGIGMTVVTQRPAVLHKDMTTQAEVLVAMQLTGVQDRKAIEAWVAANGSDEQRGALMDSLASLERGEAWIWSPAWLKTFKRVKVARRETFDSSRTPEVGERVAEPRERAAVDLAELRAAIAATAQAASGEDPALLRAQVAELEAELAEARARPTVERVPVLEAGQLERIERAQEELAGTGHELVGAAEALAAAVRTAQAVAGAGDSSPSPPAKSPTVAAAQADDSAGEQETASAGPEIAAGSEVSAAPSPTPDDGNGDRPRLARGEREMLVVLAQRHPDRLTAAQLGTLAGVAASKSTFRNYRARLRAVGLVDQDADDRLGLTKAGLELLAGEVPPRPQGTHELVAMWKSRLGGGERRLLDELVAVFPHALEAEDLGRRAHIDPAKSTFRNYRARLRHMGLVQEEGHTLRASPTLFPDAPAAPAVRPTRRRRRARHAR